MDRPPKSLSPDYVVALERGLSVIESFSRDRSEQTLSQVAAATNLSPATARRALTTLEELGYVGRSGRSFFLRPRVLGLAAAFLSSVSVDRVLDPLIQEVTREFGGNCTIAVMDGSEVLYIAHSAAHKFVRITASVGTRFPAYCTATGRVLLAGMSQQELVNYLNNTPLVALTEHTVTEPAKLVAAIEKVRKQGFALVERELDPVVVSLAVPIRSASGRVVASASSSDIAVQSSPQAMRNRLASLKRLAGSVESAFVEHPVLARAILDGRLGSNVSA